MALIIRNKQLQLFLVLLLLFAGADSVWAVDSDGDGVDDTADAFPLDPCGALDTDSDGMPDDLLPCDATVTVLFDSFETGDFSQPWWVDMRSDLLWEANTDNAVTGVYSATVPVEPTNNLLELDFILSSSGYISFQMILDGSPSPGCDFSSYDWRFTINGDGPGPYSYGGGWQEIQFELGPGSYTARWDSQTDGICFPRLDDVLVMERSLIDDLDADNNGMPDVEEDHDGDGSIRAEEDLAGTSDDDPGQRPHWWRTFDGRNRYSSFGYSVSEAGDVNGDGYDDVLIGGIGDYISGVQKPGDIEVYSGIDGSLIHLIDSGYYIGESVTDVGDVNGDGYADVAGAGGNTGSAKIYSGLDGSVFRTFSSGDVISRAGDMNNDGYEEIAIGNPLSNSNRGVVEVFNGSNGSSYWTLLGQAPGEKFGTSISDLGDINGDGYDDILIGAPENNNAGVGEDSGTLHIRGQNWVEFTMPGNSAFDNFAKSVSGIGDINSDGYPDYVVGMPGESVVQTQEGAAFVYSGIDNTQLYSYYGTLNNQRFGESVSDVGDVNGDGYNEFIIAGRGDYPVIYSGKSGAQLYRLVTELTGSQHWSVSGAGDLDGDGYADIVIGTHTKQGSNITGAGDGRAYVFLAADLANDPDLDYLVNSADPDDDNDGYLDGVDAFPLDPSEWLDTDLDGTGNNFDWDDDNDGVPDMVDADPLDNANANEVSLPLDSSYKGKSVQQDSVTQ